MKTLSKILLICLMLSVSSDALAIRVYTSGLEQQTVTAGEEFSSNGSPTGISTSVFRTGAASMRLNPSASNNWFGQVFKSSATTAESFCRIYFRYATRPTSGTPELVGFWASVAVTRQAYIRYDSTNNTLELMNSSGSQVGSDSATISADTWYRLELRFLGGTGANATIEARLDGTQIGLATNAPGVAFDACYIGAASDAATYDMYVDDIAINNTATTNASTQTSYPGDGRVAMLSVTGNGDNNPSGCNNTSPCGDTSTYWTYIDEVNPDDATTFVDMDTAIAADFNMTDSSTAGIDSYDTITLVHPYIRLREEASAATSYNLRVKSASGGTVASSTASDIGTTVWRTNPTAGNNFMLKDLATTTDPTTRTTWTPTGTNSIDNMQAGFSMTTGTADFDVSTLWVNVEFVDGSPPPAGEVVERDSVWDDE